VARGATLQAPRQDGWRLQLGGTLLRGSVHASDDPDVLGAQDLVVVTVKGPALPAVATRIGPLLGPDTVVLSAMNGVPWWFFDGRPGAFAGMRLESIDPAESSVVRSRRVMSSAASSTRAHRRRSPGSCGMPWVTA
jgi:2-dehydropantoate 2-reductase